MTDAEFEAAKARVEALRILWTPLLGLADWDIDFAYRRQDSDDLHDGDGQRSFAFTSVDWKYEHGTITAFLPEIIDSQWSDEHLAYVIVHEFMHVLLHEMRDDGKTEGIRHEEHVATRLAKAFIRTLAAQKEVPDEREA